MTRNDLKNVLGALKVGDTCVINYAAYEEMFPPGEPDADARRVCYELARQAGCKIEHDAGAATITFVRNVSHPTYKAAGEQ